MSDGREILGMLDNWRDDSDTFLTRLSLLDDLPLVDRLNVDAAEALVRFLLGNPRAHEQRMWVTPSDAGTELLDAGHADPIALINCGTTACLAGWTVILDGARIRATRPALGGIPSVISHPTARIGSHDYAWNQESVEDYAQQVLGLNSDEVDWLFFMPPTSGSSAETRAVGALTSAINKVKAARG